MDIEQHIQGEQRGDSGEASVADQTQEGVKLLPAGVLIQLVIGEQMPGFGTQPTTYLTDADGRVILYDPTTDRQI